MSDAQPAPLHMPACEAAVPLSLSLLSALSRPRDQPRSRSIHAHTATAVSPPPCATPCAFALHHTYTTRVACRLSPPPNTRAAYPSTVTPPLSCSAGKPLFRRTTNQGLHCARPFATQHTRRPVHPHTASYPSCTTHHTSDARTTVCDARPPRDDALHIQRLGAPTGRQGALGARLGDHR